MSRQSREPSLIALANDEVSIVIACRMAGVELPDDPAYGRSMKVHCPFGGLHSDGGWEKALRVYVDSNSAWCFACTAYYSPVKMLAQARDLDWTTAASVLLDAIGYQPATLDEQWAALAHSEPPPDRALLADALKTYCQRVIPGWDSRQFDRDEARLLTRCLELLDRVTSAEDAGRWLDATKTAMAKQFAPSHSLANMKFVQ